MKPFDAQTAFPGLIIGHTSTVKCPLYAENAAEAADTILPEKIYRGNSVLTHILKSSRLTLRQRSPGSELDRTAQ